MEKEERFLPIGSVVLLKGAKKELMITCYCISPKGEIYENGVKSEAKDGQMFEYGACMYPEGIIRSEIVYGFNHDQIEKVCHVGYKTEISDELSKMLNETIKKYNKIIETEEEKKESTVTQ